MDFKSWVNYIKETVSIEDVLESCDIEYNSNQMICPNPEHGDRHLGSCTFDSSSNTYRCWACGDHGDIFSIIRHKKGLSFKESCDYIVKTYNSSHSLKIPERYTKSNNASQPFFFLNNRELELIGIIPQVSASSLESSSYSKPSLNYLRTHSEPGEYVEGKSRSVSVSEMFAQAPELVKYMVLEKAKKEYQKNIAEYNTFFWKSSAFSSLDMKEKEEKIERKHLLEESFIVLDKVFRYFNIANVSFPEPEKDPKIGYSLKI